MKSLLSKLAVILVMSGVSSAYAQSDNFSTSHDYSTGNVSGTIWSGFTYSGPTEYGAGNGTLLEANSDMTNAGELTLSSTYGGFDAGGTTAPFLFIDVTGNFTATVDLTSVTTNNYDTAGLAAVGTPGAGGTVNFVSMQDLPEFDIGFEERELANGVETDTTAGYATPPTSGGYLELQRVGDVFTESYSTNGGNTYTVLNTVTDPDMSSTVELGLFDGSFGSGDTGTATFQNFSLTVAPEPSTYALLFVGLGALVFIHRRRSLI